MSERKKIEDRRKDLLREIKAKKMMSLEDLSKKLNFSKSTIRRDLKPLEESCRIKMGKGAVQFISNEPLSSTPYLDAGEEMIAEMAFSKINIKDKTVWLGGGNISIGIARRISNVTMVTNSIKTASAALKKDNVKVFLLGDEIDPETYCLHGKSLEKIQGFNFNKVFIEADGYFEKDFMVSLHEEKTASLLECAKVQEKFILIAGKNIGSFNAKSLKGLEKFKGVFIDTLKNAIFKEIESIGRLEIKYDKREFNKDEDKVILLTRKDY